MGRSLSVPFPVLTLLAPADLAGGARRDPPGVARRAPRAEVDLTQGQEELRRAPCAKENLTCVQESSPRPEEPPAPRGSEM